MPVWDDYQGQLDSHFADLANIGGRKRGRPKLVIGFAAETQNVIANAKAKLVAKGADWILANDVSPASGVMGGERNLVHLRPGVIFLR